jgi:hypothetical protein
MAVKKQKPVQENHIAANIKIATLKLFKSL